MDFGISLDPLAVPQRHTLYDSESDEDDEQYRNTIDQLSSVFAIEKHEKPEIEKFLTGKTVLVGIGTTASVFVRSFVHVRQEPLFSVQTEAGNVLAGKHFPSGRGREDVTVFYEVEGASEKWVVCAHESELRVEYSNFWTKKVG